MTWLLLLSRLRVSVNLICRFLTSQWWALVTFQMSYRNLISTAKHIKVAPAYHSLSRLMFSHIVPKYQDKIRYNMRLNEPQGLSNLHLTRSGKPGRRISARQVKILEDVVAGHPGFELAAPHLKFS